MVQYVSYILKQLRMHLHSRAF